MHRLAPERRVLGLDAHEVELEAAHDLGRDRARRLQEDAGEAVAVLEPRPKAHSDISTELVGEALQNLHDALLAGDGEPPHRRPPDQHGPGAERERA